MSPLESIYFAIGELAYAIACADGEVQKAERVRFLEIVRAELEKERAGFETSFASFQMFDKMRDDGGERYERALSAIRDHRHCVTPVLRQKMSEMLESMAAAFPGVTAQESRLLERFREDLKELYSKAV